MPQRITKLFQLRPGDSLGCSHLVIVTVMVLPDRRGSCLPQLPLKRSA
jgi:hypothetical protein